MFTLIKEQNNHHRLGSSSTVRFVAKQRGMTFNSGSNMQSFNYLILAALSTALSDLQLSEVGYNYRERNNADDD